MNMSIPLRKTIFMAFVLLMKPIFRILFVSIVIAAGICPAIAAENLAPTGSKQGHEIFVQKKPYHNFIESLKARWICL